MATLGAAVIGFARPVLANVCACYKLDGSCQVDAGSTLVNQSACESSCSLGGTDVLYDHAVWAEGPASSVAFPYTVSSSGGPTSGEEVYEDCMQDNADALAAKATGDVTLLSYTTPELAVDIPGVKFTPASETDAGLQVNYIGEYVSGVYNYLVDIGFVIATVFIMVAGLQYVFAANSGDTGKAKTRLNNAVAGFVLLLFVSIILRTVNPVLTVFSSIQGLTIIQEIPTDHLIEPSGSDGMDAPETAASGVSDWQDCMIKTFGSSKTDVQAKLKDVTFMGKTYQFHELVAPDAQAAFKEIEAGIASGSINYTFKSVGVWNWRANRNKPSYMSVHAFGGAIDINPDTNPNCKLGTSCIGNYDMPSSVVSIFKKWGFGWGGNWRSVKDYMHFSTDKFCGGSR